MQDRDWALNETQKDLLRELGNIGGGHALTSLAGLAQVTLEMGLPTLGYTRGAGAAECFSMKAGEYIGVKIDAKEDMEFSVVMLMDRAFAEMACLALSGEVPKDFGAPGDISRSCLEEIGNILCNAFVNAISTMFSLNIRTTEAAVQAGQLPQVLEALLGADGCGDVDCLLVDSEITCDGRQRTLHLLYVLDAAKAPKTLALLGN